MRTIFEAILSVDSDAPPTSMPNDDATVPDTVDSLVDDVTHGWELRHTPWKTKPRHIGDAQRLISFLHAYDSQITSAKHVNQLIANLWEFYNCSKPDPGSAHLRRRLLQLKGEALARIKNRNTVNDSRPSCSRSTPAS